VSLLGLLLSQQANEKLAKTTAWLEEEKMRAEALLYRMSGLIACFPDGPGGATVKSTSAPVAIADSAASHAAARGSTTLGGVKAAQQGRLVLKGAPLPNCLSMNVFLHTFSLNQGECARVCKANQGECARLARQV
jgi:hypothetical protein